MKKKTVTKAQREAAQKAALLQRVTDVYSGAMGQQWGDDDFATADILSRVVPTLRSIFGEQYEYEYIWAAQNLDSFDRPETAAEFLFSRGIRP